MIVYLYGMIRDVHHGEPCPYCQRSMSSRDHRLHPTRDHVIPASRGGRTKIICCQTCNGLKADMMPEQWTAYMTENPGWWLLSRAERRARRRGVRYVAPRRAIRQGTAPLPPIIVPPELIWENSQ